jgi:hypothetical protein
MQSFSPNTACSTAKSLYSWKAHDALKRRAVSVRIFPISVFG